MHCQQLRPTRITTDFRSILDHGSAPRRQYAPCRQGEKRSVAHRGQRKLLMS